MRLQYEIKSGIETRKIPSNSLASVTLVIDTGHVIETKAIEVKSYNPTWSTDLVRVEGLIEHEDARRFCVAIYRPGEDTQEAIGYVTIYTPESFPE